jgi:hypothetical protein
MLQEHLNIKRGLKKKKKNKNKNKKFQHESLCL